jgi:serine/threonine protein kinase
METIVIGNYQLNTLKGSWRNFDYYEAVHKSMGIKVLLFISKKESEIIQLEALRKLRKLGFESVLKIFDLFYSDNRLVVITELPSGSSLYDYFYTLNRPLEPCTAIDLVINILDAISELHNLGYAVGFLDESAIFLMRSSKIKISGNWLVHFEYFKVVGEFELSSDDLKEAKIQDNARCGAILFRLLNQETLHQNNLNFASLLQTTPDGIHESIINIIHKAVNLENPVYDDASKMIADLKKIRDNFEIESANKTTVTAVTPTSPKGTSVKVTAILKSSGTIANPSSEELNKKSNKKLRFSIISVALILFVLVLLLGTATYLWQGHLFHPIKSEDIPLIGQKDINAPKNIITSDSLKIFVNETIELVLQSAQIGRDSLLVKQYALDANGQKSLSYYSNLYDASVLSKTDYLDSALNKLEFTAKVSVMSLTQLDVFLAFGCLYLKKNDSKNAWLYLTKYAELFDARKNEMNGFSSESKLRLMEKRKRTTRLLSCFQ